MLMLLCSIISFFVYLFVGLQCKEFFLILALSIPASRNKAVWSSQRMLLAPRIAL